MRALVQKISQIPTWIGSTVISIILSSIVAWVTWTTVTTWKHEVRITAAEVRVDDVKTDIKDIKEGQKEMNQKLDQLLIQKHRPGR